MKTRLFSVMLVLFLATPALAWQPPKVSYSADQSMETAEGAMNGTIYVTPTMERREAVMEGKRIVTITRRDKKLIWNLMPEEQMYMETPLNAANRPDDPGNYQIQQTPMGPDEVNGVPCEKSKVIMTLADGSKLGGFWWTSKQGIIVKMDVLSKSRGEKQRITSELSNLKIGQQPASLFEIPAGYSAMGLGGMMGMGGGSAPPSQGDDQQPSSQPAKSKDGVDVKGLIKKGFQLFN